MFVSKTLEEIMRLEMQIENCEEEISDCIYRDNLEDANYHQ